MSANFALSFLALAVLVQLMPVGHSVYFAVPNKKPPTQAQVKANADNVEMRLIQETLLEVLSAQHDLQYAEQKNTFRYFPVRLAMEGKNYATELRHWNVETVFGKADSAFNATVTALCSKPSELVKTKYEKTEIGITRLMLDAQNSEKLIEVYTCE